MTREEFQAKRDALFAEAEAAVDVNDLETAKAKKREIEELDDMFEKAIEAKADLDALEGKKEGAPQAVKNDTTLGQEVDKVEKIFDAASPEYRTAFLKNLLGREMTAIENEAFVHTTSTSGMPLPREMVNAIWSQIEEEHAIVGDVTMYRTGTILEVVKHTAITQGAASTVDENAANDDEKNTFVKVTLSGKDFSKHVDITYAAAIMAIDAFEAYLKNEIAAGIGAAIANDIITQIGSDMTGGNKKTAAASDKFTVSEIGGAFGAIKRAGALKVYCRRSTLYKFLVGMATSNGYPVFQPSMQAGAAASLFGAEIRVEEAVPADTILVGDPKKVVYNMIQDIMIEDAKDIKKHVYTYSGYARGQGALCDPDAFASLAAAEATTS